ncbi:maleylpyruvate isomerase family mycothiol-dependent enzyme [Arthrobacter sp. ATA002]|uniref:maleylpyruvate isomerase family mycothiol-dependent enzyme n=1 Tax=Arthrobacter sp. ATA002 TaxID=2991715 RepID=UPI0022A7F21E|nr:maleylpyruvate isomerase family mycothiol-dependent enzyme [Arthrobacter sp. ATA002]WAP50642.1 maleylpyruvate isomerase family mycothiol-dependent enzyme [Arthrobacter sp. ATA002]
MKSSSEMATLWALVHTERARLAEDLSSLSNEQWQHGTLCGQWNVEQVLAHLTAAASLNQRQWLQSMVAARFRPDVHNQRRLAEHLGRTPDQTLARFREVIDSTAAPSSHTAAYLGEVVVHAQDIRQPLGLPRTPDLEALAPVAEFFAARDFTVPSRSYTDGLQLRATDARFTAGYGLLVTGPILALVMSIAGRAAYLHQLTGPGAALLRARVQRGLGAGAGGGRLSPGRPSGKSEFHRSRPGGAPFVS